MQPSLFPLNQSIDKCLIRIYFSQLFKRSLKFALSANGDIQLATLAEGVEEVNKYYFYVGITIANHNTVHSLVILLKVPRMLLKWQKITK